MMRLAALTTIWAMATAARGEEPLPLETMVLLGALIVGVLLVRGIAMRRFVGRGRRGSGKRPLSGQGQADEN
jgi:hypothetical protein